MPTRERPADRGRRLARDDLTSLRGELRRARIGSGLSLRAVAAASGLSHVTVFRFERGMLDALDVTQLGALASVLGMDLRLRAYPAGDALRDAAQIRLLERLRMHLHGTLRWRTEVPVTAGDRRAWDAVIAGSTWVLPVEAETVLADLQAVERRIERKRVDAGANHVLIAVTDTRRNRTALRAAPGAFGGFSRDRRPVLRALRSGRDPDTDAIILL